MAANEAGSVEVRVIPEALVAEWQRELEKTASLMRANVKASLKLSKGEIGKLVKSTQAEMNKRKTLPVLPVKLNIAKSEVRRVVKEINAHTKTLDKKPSINVGLSITQREVRRAIADANARILAAKSALPKLKVLIDLDENQQKLVNETVVTVKEIDASLRASGAHISIPVELDEKSLKAISAKALAAYKTAQSRIDAEFDNRFKKRAAIEEAEAGKTAGALRGRAEQAAAIDDEIRRKLDITRLDRERTLNARLFEDQQKHDNRIQNLLRANLDARSLEELKHVNKVALIHERAELAKQASSLTTLRRLRNDLSQFDQTTTRFLRRASLGFGIFTAGVTASFAAIAGFALKSFADTEQQLRRTAAVLGTDVFSKTVADLSDAGVGAAEAQKRAFAAFGKEVNRTNAALQETVNLTALGTVFDQTEIATGTRALAQAGLTIDQIKVSMLGVAQFAQNEELLPEEAVQNLVQGATAAGESLSTLSALADKFTFVANNTTASATEVAAAFANRAAPAFRAYGEEVSATLTVLDLFAASGIKGKTAGEQAGILIREVNKASTKTPATIAAWEKYGIAIGKVNGEQVPFLQTLGELGTLLDNVRTQKGSQELAKLRKELGLTEKSGAGLLQLLPQITEGTKGSADEAVKRLQNLQKQISGSTGATARQASVLMDSLSFQTDLLGNQITSLFKAAAAPGGKALTQVFKDLNGEVKIVNGELVQTGGVVGDLQKKFVKVGKQLSDAIVPALQRFATGGEGVDFFSGLFNMYKGFLGGLRDAFGEFRREVFGEGSNRGFFSVMGDAFASLGRFAASTLPRIGKTLGVIVGFIKDNRREVDLFLKAWLGLFLVSKALRLFIIPLVGVYENLKAINSVTEALMSISFVRAIGQWAAGMVGYNTVTAVAVVETNALAAAQARLAAANTARDLLDGPIDIDRSFRRRKTIESKVPDTGFNRFSKNADVVTATAEVTALGGSAAASTQKVTLLARVSQILASTMSGLGRALGVVIAGLKLGAKLFVPVIVGAGVLKGILDQLNSSMGGDGNVSFNDFKKGIVSVTRAIGDVIGPIVSFINWTTKLLFTLGKIAGAIATLGIVKLFEGIAWVVRSVVGFVRDLPDAFKDAAAGIAESVPVVGPAIKAYRDLRDAIKGVKDAVAEKTGDSNPFGEQSTLRIQTGLFFEDIAGRWEPHSATLAGIFNDTADGILAHEREIDAKSAELDRKRKERIKAAAKEAAAAAKVEFEAINVLGVANDKILPKYIKLTAAQKAMGHSQETAARVATDFQKKQANAAYVSDLLAGKVNLAGLGMDRFAAKAMLAADMQRVLANSTQFAAKNFVNLLGGEDKLQTMLENISTGNRRAARSFMAAARDSQRAAVSKAKTIIASAKAEIAAIGASAQVSMRASVVQGILAGKMARAQKALKESEGFIKESQALVDSLLANSEIGEIPDIAGAGDAASEAAEKTVTAADRVAEAAQKATDAVNAMTVAQFKVAANATIARILKLPETYKATAREAAILKAAMPAVDAALAKQTEAVTKLDEALQALQSTQLEGTKVFSDQNFALDQQVKALQLQRLDLVIGGAVEENPAVKAIDDQIKALQQQTERLSLVESLQLDPLKRKLEETFNPVKELSFQSIIDQFQQLNNQKVVLDARVSKTETLKARLEQVAGDAAEKFKGVGLNVTGGINAGITEGRTALLATTKKLSTDMVAATDTALGISSPSKVMHQRGVWTVQGFTQGIQSQRSTTLDAVRDIRSGALLVLDNGREAFANAGKDVMTSFRLGMRSIYVTEVQPFVLTIAQWIRDNKGPISYDAQLLRPAGEAIMSGFHRGLNDGFGEVKSWVGGVAGQIGDNFPDNLLFERSAKFLLNNAKLDPKSKGLDWFQSKQVDALFTAEDAFGDLVGDIMGGIGSFDPSLSFLHKTLSAADTKEMAQRLIAMYPSMNFNPGSSQFLRPAGTRTASGFISDHTEGTAVDLGTGGARPTAESRALFAKLKPLLGTIFKQLIHNGLGLSASGGTFPDSAHYDHIHASFLKGEGFDMNSGKKGVGMLNLPGVPADVLEGISYAAQKLNMDPRLIAAVMKQESGFRKNVVSGDGGYGLMQLTSAGLVAEARGMGSIFDPKINTYVGAKYLRDLINQLGSQQLGLSAYNSGPGGGERYGRVDVPDYVRKVLAHLAEIMRQTGGRGVGTFRRQGGHLNAGQASWVGEGGREVWVPDRSGTVISNSNIEGLIRLAQSGQITSGGKGDYIDQRQIHVKSNAADPQAVADQVDAKISAQIVKVVR